MSLLDRSLPPFSSITIHWRRHVMSPCRQAPVQMPHECALGTAALPQPVRGETAREGRVGDAVAGGCRSCAVLCCPGRLWVAAGCRFLFRMISFEWLPFAAFPFPLRRTNVHRIDRTISRLLYTICSPLA